MRISGRSVSLLIGALALSMSVMACDSDNSKLTANNEQVDTGQEPGNNNEGGAPDASEPGAPDIEEPKEEEPGGEDVDEFVPGFLHGSWTALGAEDDEHIGEFMLIHEDGESDITGTFLAGDGLYDGMVVSAKGNIGDASSFDGNTLIIEWNPTTQEDELMTITGEKTSDDEFSANMKAELNQGLDLDMVLTRVAGE